MDSTMTEPTVKTCSRCRVTKPLGEFGPKKDGKFGRMARCLVCEAARVREHYWREHGIPTEEWPRLHTRNAQDRNMRNLNAWFGGKWCPSCEMHLPVENFHADASAADGLQGRCAVCHAERCAAYLQTPGGRAANNARDRRRRTLKAGLPVDGSDVPDWLAHTEELDAWNCHLCGSAFRPGDEIHWDHRDPVSTGTAGTVVANMAAAHASCNVARGNTPLDEWHARVGTPEGIV